MQITDSMQDALNTQLTREFQAGYNYYAMASWLEEEGFPGMAAWMNAQSDEEWLHARRIGKHVLDRDGSVAPGPIEAPTTTFASVAAVFAAGLDQERTVSAHINDLYAQASDERDFAALQVLDWFVAEQIEEEAAFKQIVDDLRLAGDDSRALLLLDRELGRRGTPPAAG